MISAVILTNNEEKNISRCIKSLGFCDEIVLIDDYSVDNTSKLARKLGTKIFKRRLNNDFSKQRNFGLSKAGGDWVLFVDADEQVSRGLSEEIKRELAFSRADGYLVKREGIVDEYILRLAKRDAGSWGRAVHEKWNIKGKIGKLHSPLLHSPSRGLFPFLEKLNKYSTLHALENQKEGKKSSLLKIVFMPILKFLQYFIARRGFRLGTKGFVDAMFMGLHSFLAWSKQWEQF